MNASSDIAAILTLADAYGAALGLARSTVSLRIAKSGSLLRKLAAGEAQITLARRDRIIRAFSARWPEGCPWPREIPRPPAEEATR